MTMSTGGVTRSDATTTQAWAPGRVNIIGEHVDYNDGIVLPMAIALGCTATVTLRRDRVISLTSVQRPGQRVDVDWRDLVPGRLQGWAAYAAGAVWATTVDQPDPAGLPGLDVTIDGQVPAGAGLSSSASVECAVGLAVGTALGLHFTPRERARRAQRAENEFVGVPTGSMDQVISTMGQDGCALAFDIREDSTRAIPIELPGMAFLVVDTRAKHALVDGGYARRREACQRAAHILGVGSLREVADLEAALEVLRSTGDQGELVRRVRHVVTEIARVGSAIAALESRDSRSLGLLMLESHSSLRDDYEVSCTELDIAVESACEAGAVGARMTGGGFGGSALALVPVEALNPVQLAVEKAFKSSGCTPPRFFRVRPGGGAHMITP